MIFVLAYPEFEPSCTDRIQAFRTQHEPGRAGLVRAHVTLVFGVSDRYLHTVAALVEKVSSQTSAFPVGFDDHVIEFDPFEHKHKILLLCGEGARQLTALHNQLYEGEHSAEFDTTHPFRPHITIATCNERAEIEQVDLSDVGALPLYGHVLALEVVQLVEGRLKTLKSAPLAG